MGIHGQLDGAVVKTLCCKSPGCRFKPSPYLFLFYLFPYGIISWLYILDVLKQLNTHAHIRAHMHTHTHTHACMHTHTNTHPR